MLLRFGLYDWSCGFIFLTKQFGWTHLFLVNMGTVSWKLIILWAHLILDSIGISLIQWRSFDTSMLLKFRFCSRIYMLFQLIDLHKVPNRYIHLTNVSNWAVRKPNLICRCFYMIVLLWNWILTSLRQSLCRKRYGLSFLNSHVVMNCRFRAILRLYNVLYWLLMKF